MPTAHQHFDPIAHLADDGREHALAEHLEKVGALAGEFASKWQAGAFGQAAGVLHDLGKYAFDFQSYIRAANRSTAERRDAGIEGEETSSSPRRGQVDHSSAGALKARELYGPLGELLAFVIAGHHAGLANRPDLSNRLERKKGRLEDALAGGPPEGLFSRQPIVAPFTTKPTNAEASELIKRRLELWTRMLFSALCDADFLDTEEFFDRGLAQVRESRRLSIDALLARLAAHVDEKQATAP